MPTDSSSGADTALALAEALRGARASLSAVRLTPLAERRARETARFEAHGAQLAELKKQMAARKAAQGQAAGAASAASAAGVKKTM